MTPHEHYWLAFVTGLLICLYLRFILAVVKYKDHIFPPSQLETLVKTPTSLEIVEHYAPCFLCFMPLDKEDDKSYILFKGKMTCRDRQGCMNRRGLTEEERFRVKEDRHDNFDHVE